MSIDYFQSNSSAAFPRCTEAKYAGKDDRLQILDVRSFQANFPSHLLAFFLGIEEWFDSTYYLWKRYG